MSIKDPAPALVIQDELHLLSEELGTFAAHYETLWQHLCAVGSGLPSKVLAATATISDYENQVRQLYALTPRRFPTDGWADGESFYASGTTTLSAACSSAPCPPRWTSCSSPSPPAKRCAAR